MKFPEKDPKELTLTEIAYYARTEDLILISEQGGVNWDPVARDKISFHFFHYLLRKSLKATDPSLKYELEDPPWTVINDVFESVGLPLNIICPMEGKLPPNSIDWQVFGNDEWAKLINIEDNFEYEIRRFSSGELLLISLALSIYYSDERGINRNLILMDEPTAHLHPSLIKHFYNIVYRQLVKKHNIRVIMTTHSPSTLALAPDEPEVGIFEMTKKPTTVIPVKKIKAIEALSKGLVVVQPNTTLLWSKVLATPRSTDQFMKN